MVFRRVRDKLRRTLDLCVQWCAQLVQKNTDKDHSALSGEARLVLAALGIVYGDIGTCPLYALKTAFGGDAPLALTPENVLGVLSLIFWLLVVIVSIKYIVFVLRSDNRGEGGIMALLALAMSVTRGRRWTGRVVLTIGALGAGMFYGDGIVAPAVSVLSALEGLEIAMPAFQPYVVPSTILVLFGLFYVQYRGTDSVARLFGPVMAVWFLTLALLGLFRLVGNPGVLRALDPRYGIDFLTGHRAIAFVALGAIVLAVTGAESLYAGMGHLGRRPIQLAWFRFALPALLLNYFGQSALLLSDPSSVDNPFFRLAPDWMLYPLIGLSTISTVIASQAVISGAFSITRQAMQLGFVPRCDVKFTSEKTQGQIYLPGVNWGLFCAVVILVLGFRTTQNLAGAYGVAVTGAMVSTSLLSIVVIAQRWGWLKAAALFGCFLTLEIALFSVATLKIPEGGWVPLLAGLLAFFMMSTWRQGRQLLFKRISDQSIRMDEFIDTLDESALTRVPGTAIFMTSDIKHVPDAMLHNLKHNKVLHERVLFFHVKLHEKAHISERRRIELRWLKNGFYTLIVHYGFMDEPDIPLALEKCAEHGLEIEMMEASFFLGRVTVMPKKGRQGVAFWRKKIFAAMYRNASSATEYYRIPYNRVVELGAQIVL
ncbi:MAG: potassium transporter Kup [Candidatus Accumulibacter sp.]|jgi:KUP system potassium uptake protein|nr:potassium transporter Kup [Accumulibacter sp.]